MKDLYGKLVAAGVSGAVALSGAFLVAPSEGIVLGTYKDPVGIVTSCFGHTGPELRMGQKFTEEQCVKQLGEDLVKHDKQLASVVKVPYKSDYQHASLLSFTYNVGIGNVKSSTLLRKLNSYDYDGACYELTKWTFATKNGVKVWLKGLFIRRTNEYAWCMNNPPEEIKNLINQEK
ncbi:Lysozyme RrrD [compost metagenome]